MATRTSTQSGNWSDTATWGGSAKPGAGDIAVIATGHTVTVDENTTVGDNASGIGHAIDIQATNASVFGKLVVNSGVTLTLRGFDGTSNTLMQIDRFAKFEPASGSTISGDTAGDYSSFVDNRGHITANGVTFTAPSANVNWATNVASEAVISHSIIYDHPANQRVIELVNKRIANAANTGLGSFGDTSLSFSSVSPAGILATEVASVAAVDGVGKYYVNYDTGTVILYTTAAITATAAYKHLTLSKTWGIKSIQNTADHSATFTGCTFEYMGGVAAAENRAIALRHKKTPGANSASSDRVGIITGCTFRFCNLAVLVDDCTGTSGDPFVSPSSCTFGYSAGSGAFGYSVTSRLGTNAYWQITGNTLNVLHQFLTVRKFISSATVPDEYVGFKLNSNTGTCGQLAASMIWANIYPDGEIKNNTLTGLGPADDPRWCDAMGGKSGQPMVISGNTLHNMSRLINAAPYSVIEKNLIHYCPHHGIIGPVENDVYVPEVTVRNNFYYGNFTDSASSSTWVEAGYNHRHHIDSWTVVNNTVIDHPQGVFGFGDIQDNAGNALNTRMVIANNLVYNATSGGAAGGQAAIKRSADTTARVTRVHCTYLDRTLAYNVTATYEGTNVKGGQFSKGGTNYNAQGGGSRNVTGLALFAPSYGSSQSGIEIVYTHTSATDRTLTPTDSGGAGAAVQLVKESTSASSAGAHATQSASGYRSHGTWTDTSKTWSTTANNANCPRAKWLLVTADPTTPASVGQIRAITNNTATVLTITPAWATLPSIDADAVIIESEVTLTPGSAETIQAGIYLPDLPTSTQTDTAISYALNDVTSDPQLVAPSGTAAADFKIGSASPAKDAATADHAPAADYFGTARPQGAADDIGAHEYQAAGDLLLRLQADGLSCQGGLL